MNGYFKDTRLIEAFDYIDPKYIAEVGESLKLHSVYTKEGEQKRSPFRTHLIQITALVACVLLLALAAPMFTHLPEIINSFAAGGTEDETTEEVPYLQFSPDLEPISQELVDEINEAFIPFYLRMTKEELVAKYGEDYLTGGCADCLVIQGPDDCYGPYLATIGDYVVFIFGAFSPYGPMQEDIGGYAFEEHTYVYCTETQTMYRLKQAYENGLLKDKHLKLVSERRAEFFDYVKEHRELLW